jgi:sterol desaturase/sphingolipid hydroxylase (fatty acid hydroxylase superfamily)
MVDLTVAAIPFYFGTMGAEAAWWRKRRAEGIESPGDYERNDTIASLSMGVGSLLVPLLSRPLMRNFDIARGKWARAALGVAGGAALLAAAADAVARAEGLEAGRVPETDTDGSATASNGSPEQGREAGSTGDPATSRSGSSRRARLAALARKVGGSSAMAAIAAGGAIVAGTWANRTMAHKVWKRRILPDWGNGPAAAVAAVFAWDAIYYWNHRIQHESRYLWAIHVVHHSSEHYNLSTALRQPVAESLGTFVPYSLMALAGFRPELIEQARGVNLIYQYWIHTEVIRKLGPLEKVFNTPSHHRAHHGANRQYLDRNHGSILIIWDKLFGTFEPEGEPVRYGLTKNIDTFNPLRVATHEYADIVSDVAHSDNWADRISFVVRGPGWAYARRDELGMAQPAGATEAPEPHDRTLAPA